MRGGCARPVRALAAAAALVVLMAACGGDDTIAEQARSGDGKGYVAGDGTVKTFPAADRGAPVEGVEGETLDGGRLDVGDLRGSVVVLNVWGSWCGPCTREAPDLQASSVELADRGVRFVGIDIRDDRASARAFERKVGITYPSIFDEDMSVLLALRGKASTTPSTLVLDPQGRVAARVAGPVERSTLVGLVEDVLAEQA